MGREFRYRCYTRPMNLQCSHWRGGIPLSMLFEHLDSIKIVRGRIWSCDSEGAHWHRRIQHHLHNIKLLEEVFKVVWERTDEIKSHWSTLHRRLHLASCFVQVPPRVVLYLTIECVHQQNRIIYDSAGNRCVLDVIQQEGTVSVRGGNRDWHSQITRRRLGYIWQCANLDIIQRKTWIRYIFWDQSVSVDITGPGR